MLTLTANREEIDGLKFVSLNVNYSSTFQVLRFLRVCGRVVFLLFTFYSIYNKHNVGQSPSTSGNFLKLHFGTDILQGLSLTIYMQQGLSLTV
jgi:hypothetical protein